MKRVDIEYKFYMKDDDSFRELKNSLRINSILEIISKYFIKEFNNLKILEYGCNKGFAIKSIALKHKSFECIGVDVIEDIIIDNLTKYKDIPNLKFIAITEDKLPFPDNYFDIVYSSEVIEHISIDKRDKYYSEFFRVLNPKGIGYISYPNFWFPIELHYKIPFHHWFSKLLKLKNLVYQEIPSFLKIRKEISKYFDYIDITKDFLESSYVKKFYSNLEIFITKILARTLFKIQDYLILIPKK